MAKQNQLGIKTWTASEVIKATGARSLFLEGGEGSDCSRKEFRGIGTDTRGDLKGRLFVALRGDQFDAHKFLSQAIEGGSLGLVVDRIPEGFQASIPIFQVADTLQALQDLAHYFRRSYPEKKYLALTGSNGKTTTKAFAATLVGSTRKVYASKGSFNNHWGVPITLLEAPLETEVVLIEMGMNHAGELTKLVQIAEPQVVLCTMVGQAHIEHFGSVEKIAEAKHEIYAAADLRAIRVYNLDNPWTYQMWQSDQKSFPKGEFVTFSSRGKPADVSFELKSLNPKRLCFSGAIRGHHVPAAVEVPIFGVQNLVNLAAASALALSAGLSPEEVWSALPLCRTTWGRNQVEELLGGGFLIFDAYNANPESMRALLNNVHALQVGGRKILVLGEMKEMGGRSAELHQELGGWVQNLKADEVYFFGEHWQDFLKGAGGQLDARFRHAGVDFEDQISEEIAKRVGPGDLIALKASRGMRFERFLRHLKLVNSDLASGKGTC